MSKLFQRESATYRSREGYCLDVACPMEEVRQLFGLLHRLKGCRRLMDNHAMEGFGEVMSESRHRLANVTRFQGVRP